MTVKIVITVKFSLDKVKFFSTGLFTKGANSSTDSTGTKRKIIETFKIKNLSRLTIVVFVNNLNMETVGQSIRR